jgi:hypothetical protein
MGFNKLTSMATAVFMLFVIVEADLQAAAASVSCTRVGSARSIASVVGSSIGAGNFYAIAASGGKAYKAVIKPANSLGRVGFIFDSNATAGTARIPANFIQGMRVDGYIRQALTNRLIAAIGAICIAK